MLSDEPTRVLRNNLLEGSREAVCDTDARGAAQPRNRQLPAAHRASIEVRQ